MKIFEIAHFLTIRNYLSIVVVACLVSGCTSVPQTLKDIGAELLEHCPKEINLDSEAQSVLLTSIETDIVADEFYLLLENDTGDKYLMGLRPRKFGMPTVDVIEHHRFRAKTFCYVVKPGHYHITKVIGVFRMTLRSGGTTKIIEENSEYKHTKDFDVPPNRATYLGRYILLDPRMKDKGYLGRIGEMMSGMIKGSIRPSTIEINVTDGINEDSAWMLDEHKQIRSEQVINISRH